jgi:hypothetical protein
LIGDVEKQEKIARLSFARLQREMVNKLDVVANQAGGKFRGAHRAGKSFGNVVHTLAVLDLAILRLTILGHGEDSFIILQGRLPSPFILRVSGRLPSCRQYIAPG